MAFPANYDFNYYRGDTHEFVLRPKNADGSTYQLDSYVGNASFVIANKRGSGSTKYIAQAIVNSATDTITCTILPAVGSQLSSGKYVYEIQIIDGSTKVITLLTGAITVTDSITGVS